MYRWPIRFVAIAIIAAAGVLLTQQVGDIDVLSLPIGDEAAVLPLPGYLAVGTWEEASEVHWDRATTGWEAITATGRPARGENFEGGPISIAGSSYEDGLSVYPYAEIDLTLDGHYSLLEAHVGVDDASRPRSGVVFSVVVDGRTAYTSAPLRRGDAGEHASISLMGARTARLIAAQDPGSAAGAYANWADLRLFRPTVALGDLSAASLTMVPALPTPGTPSEAERRDFANRAVEEAAYVAGRALPTGGRVAHLQDSTRGRYGLVNDDLAVIWDAAGEAANSFTVVDLRRPALLLDGASLRVLVDGVPGVPVATASAEGEPFFAEIAEPGLGAGSSMLARLSRSDGSTLVLRFSLFTDSRHLVLEADAPGVQGGGTVSYAFLGGHSGPSLVAGRGAEVVADFSRPRHLTLLDDGLLRTLVVDAGKPAILWGGALPGSVVLSTIDESVHIPRLDLTVPPGSAQAQVEFVVTQVPGLTKSARVMLDFPSSADLRESTSTYKRVMHALYPPVPVPDWFRFQWLSWYPFDMDISSARIKSQADLIARHFQDLGPWHVLVDAGWYVAEGRPGSDLRRVDSRRFPEGLRAMIADLHAKDLKVVMYINTPFITSRRKDGEWVGLRGTVEEHPGILVPIGPRSDPVSFVFDYSTPGLRSYMQGVIADLVRRADADGLKIDGLGGAEGVPIARSQRDAQGVIRAMADQTTEILRFTAETANRMKPGLYFEGGWHNPGFAGAYAHTFRYGDDVPEFSSPYPIDGLVEHIDYATYMKTVLGQRPNMGALTDENPTGPINLAWLQAGIALDSHVELSFDLAKLTNEEVAEYRALLNHHRPFTGQTRVDRALEPSVLVSKRGETVYVGLLNRSFSERAFDVRLADYGLDPSSAYSVYDVTDKRTRSVQRSLTITLAPRSFRLYILTAQPDVVWTSSKHQIARSGNRLTIDLTGPSHVPGFAAITLPRAARGITVDGISVTGERDHSGPSGAFSYRAPDGLATFTYGHDRGHRIEIEL